jgi:DNA-binding MarR family transcriptional regulator
MKLEEAIRQTKSKNEHHKVLLNLIYAAGVINAEQTRFFKSYDISPQQYNVLRILRGQYPNTASVGLVQERMLDQMSNASRLVEKLKLKKLLSRKECKLDRRQVDLVITENGLSLLAEIDKHSGEFEMKLAKLNDDEATVLNQLLDKICD